MEPADTAPDSVPVATSDPVDAADELPDGPGEFVAALELFESACWDPVADPGELEGSAVGPGEGDAPVGLPVAPNGPGDDEPEPAPDGRSPVVTAVAPGVGTAGVELCDPVSGVPELGPAGTEPGEFVSPWRITVLLPCTGVPGMFDGTAGTGVPEACPEDGAGPFDAAGTVLALDAIGGEPTCEGTLNDEAEGLLVLA